MEETRTTPHLSPCDPCSGTGNLIAWGGPQKGQSVPCGSCAGTGAQPPVFTLQEKVQELAETVGYAPEELMSGTWTLLRDLGWTKGLPVAYEDLYKRERESVEEALNAVSDLDATDNTTFAVLWGLLAADVLADVPGLRTQVEDWATWIEGEYYDEEFPLLLPHLPEEEEA